VENNWGSGRCFLIMTGGVQRFEHEMQRGEKRGWVFRGRTRTGGRLKGISRLESIFRERNFVLLGKVRNGRNCWRGGDGGKKETRPKERDLGFVTEALTSPRGR